MRNRASALFLTGLMACAPVKDTTGADPTPEQPKPESPSGLDCDTHTAGTSTRGDYLCAHNDERASVVPAAAAPLPPLKWNTELAKVAQAWAEKCTWEHNANRGSEYTAISGIDAYVGENLYVSSAPQVSPYDAVAAWAGEGADYDYAANTCAAGKMCGHYTQVVWAETREVGCGMAVCESVAGLSNATLVVCDYAPGGNIVGQKPY